MSPTEQEARALVEAWYEGKNTFIPQFRLDDLIARLVPLVERAQAAEVEALRLHRELEGGGKLALSEQLARAEAERDKLYDHMASHAETVSEQVLELHGRLQKAEAECVALRKGAEEVAQAGLDNLHRCEERLQAAEANVARLRDALTNLQWMLQTPSSVSLIPCLHLVREVLAATEPNK